MYEQKLPIPHVYICFSSFSRGNGLAELDNDTLTCYGPGSVDSLDRNWGVQAAGAVTVIVFRFIEFGDIVSKAFTKIRSKFPSVTVSAQGHFVEKYKCIYDLYMLWIVQPLNHNFNINSSSAEHCN